MSIGNLFKMDVALEKNGVIIDYGDFRVKIARAGGSNKKFSKLFQAKMKPHRRQIDNDNLHEDVATKIMAEAYAETVILDMDVKQEDGSYVQGILADDSTAPMEFTVANVTKLLVDYPEFFRDIQSQANQISLFKAAELEEDVKN